MIHIDDDFTADLEKVTLRKFSQFPHSQALDFTIFYFLTSVRILNRRVY